MRVPEHPDENAWRQLISVGNVQAKIQSMGVLKKLLQGTVVKIETVAHNIRTGPAYSIGDCLRGDKVT